MSDTERVWIRDGSADTASKSWSFVLTIDQAIDVWNSINRTFGKAKTVILDKATDERIVPSDGGTFTYYSPRGQTPSSIVITRAELLAEVVRLQDLHAAGEFGGDED